jgi:hypothetical protein
MLEIHHDMFRNGASSYVRSIDISGDSTCKTSNSLFISVKVPQVIQASIIGPDKITPDACPHDLEIPNTKINSDRRGNNRVHYVCLSNECRGPNLVLKNVLTSRSTLSRSGMFPKFKFIKVGHVEKAT